MNNKIAYIVGGIGRCGTTLIFKFLSSNYYSQKFTKNLNKIDTSILTSNTVFKTHSPFPPKNPKNMKALFMFGNIYNIVTSYRQIWSPKSASHLYLNEEVSKNKDLFSTNVLKLERHFKHWIKPQKFPVMIVRYETMYQNMNEILKFLGLNPKKIKFPSQKKRTTSWKNLPNSDKDKLIKSYKHVQEYVDNLPDIEIMPIIKE